MVLGIDISPEQVALCMIQLKVARAKNGGFHRDSFVDIAGYARCVEMLTEERAAKDRQTEEQLTEDQPINPIWVRRLAALKQTSHQVFKHDNGRVCGLEELFNPDGSWDRSRWIVMTSGNENDSDESWLGSICFSPEHEEVAPKRWQGSSADSSDTR